MDSAGQLFIQDQDRGDIRIRKIFSGGIITTVLASGGICCYGSGVMAVDDAGNLFTAEGNRVRKTAPNGSSTIVAGGGALFGVSGDGGPATQAALSGPTALAVNGAGDLFISEGLFFAGGQSRIRKVSPNGIIITVPGGVLDSPPPSSGDGGPAIGAPLQLAVRGLGVASGLAVDAEGNLFIAETGNHRIRKVSPNGIFTTVAGVGPGCPGRLLNDCLPLGDGGLATSAALSLPTGVAIDSKGNLFIADYGNRRVRKVSPDGIITTVAGNGTNGSSGDGGPATSAQVSASAIAVDGAGNLFLATTRVRKVSPDGIITTVVSLGSGSATALAVNSAGDLFIVGLQGGDNDDDCCYRCLRSSPPRGCLACSLLQPRNWVSSLPL